MHRALSRPYASFWTFNLITVVLNVGGRPK